jgi:pyruvate/2-oxoglutarate dehydrogenase complex dihydrolipoamide dehydrogenase (E3) component
MEETFDVICIAAGPAGEALTSDFAGSGLSLAVVEKALVGGECAYYGCMPSKTLLRSAEVIAEAGRARELAASRVDWTVDFNKVHARVEWMTRQLDDTPAAQALEDEGAKVFRGQGRLTGQRTVIVEDRKLTARRSVVIATGTAPSAPPIPGLDSVSYWTNREAVHAAELPETLVIIGSGAAGVELGQAFARLGSKVTILEMAPRIMQAEEPEAAEFLAGRLTKEGIAVHTGVKIQGVQGDARGVRVGLADGSSHFGARLLVAAGRRPNIDGIDIQAAGLSKTSRGMIQVDPKTLRAGDGIYAIGDINGLGGFTHLADYHGRLVAHALRGQPAVADHAAIPRVTFTDPEIGSVGMSEQQARAAGITVEIVSQDVGRTGRGYIHGEPGGVIKLVADADHDILVGATIVSPRAGEMLSELTMAIKLRIPVEVLSDTIHPFPTFSRVFQGMFAELVKKVGARRRVTVG